MKRAKTLCGALLVAASISLISSASAAHPGRNGLIAYADGAAIYSIYPDGSHKTKLTKPTYDTQYATLHLDAAAYPKWSPNGKKIAFVASMTQLPGGEQDTSVVVMDSDGSDLHWISNSGVKGAISWSPDGSHIAYLREAYIGSLDRVLEIANANGVGVTTLRVRGELSDPAWSPDGHTIVFGETNPRTLEAVDADGSHQRTLIHEMTVRHLDWSPDGTKLLFDDRQAEGGGGTVYSANADGSNVRPLNQDDPAWGYMASWSPDGTKIVLTVQASDFTESIKYLKPDGTVQGLAFGPVSGAMPNWQPCGLGARCPDTTPCVVPRVTGLSLTRARTALRKAHCVVGTMKRQRHVALGKAVVSRQSPRPKTRLPNGGKVNLVLRPRR